MTRVARPGITLPSHTSVGIPRARAAATSGTARYPPVVNSAAGRSRPRIHHACGMEAPSRIGSSTVCAESPAERSERTTSSW
jgi:hypothetical protein